MKEIKGIIMERITLSAPLIVGGKPHPALSIRASTVGDEEDAQALAVNLGRPEVPLTTELCLFSIVTDVSYDDLRALPTSDYEKLRAAYKRVNRPRPLQAAAPKTPQEAPPETSPETPQSEDTMPESN
ncbi:phage tail assembly protein [Desulfovibrio sp. OttesenSCG-928-G11]|nr:phage tail assembly protein [Desulfovibrio sp. OttesenSCG-928-G11]